MDFEFKASSPRAFVGGGNSKEAIESDSQHHENMGSLRFANQTRTLDQAMVQLRKKLGDNAGEPKHLITVHGVGYKLATRLKNSSRP